MSGEQPEILWNVNTANFEVEVYRRPNGEVQGWFEHHEEGDEYGGGLWFDALEDGTLTVRDFDGVFELPEEVQQALKDKGVKLP